MIYDGNKACLKINGMLNGVIENGLSQGCDEVRNMNVFISLQVVCIVDREPKWLYDTTTNTDLKNNLW